MEKIIKKLMKKFKQIKLLYRPYLIYKPYKIIERKYIRIPLYAVVYDDINLIFYRIPKNAGTSITKMLSKISGEESYKKRSIPPEKIKEYFSFTIVRNPYDRVVSFYEDKMRKPCEPGVVTTDFRLHEDMPFKDFVKILSKRKDKNLDRHFRSQSYFLENRKIDFIARFENLKEDYKKIMKKARVKNPPELPHKRKSKRKKDYRDYYDEETKKLVQERYKRDLELFDYKF